MDDEIPVLSVGSVAGDGDSQSRAWSSSVMTIARRVQEVRQNRNSPLNLNVIYHIDGRLAPNEFEGVRTGRFSKKLNLLAVQVAVQNTAASPDDRARILLQGLNDALNQAEAWVRKKGIAENLTELRGIFMLL